MPTIEGISFSRFREGQKVIYRNTLAEVQTVRKNGVEVILEGDTHPRFIPESSYRSFKLYWSKVGDEILLDLPIDLADGSISIRVRPQTPAEGQRWEYRYALLHAVHSDPIVSGRDPEGRVFGSQEEAKEQALKTINRIFRL